MGRTARTLVLLLLLLQSIACARSLVGITTWPSFRLGNDVGRFDWYFDLRWSSLSVWGELADSSLQVTWLDFEPSVGGNYALYDSLFTAYIGGALGTLLQFENNAYSDQVNITLMLGGGLEWPLTEKLSLVSEYLLSGSLTFYPDGSIYDVSFGLHNRPSVQLRYYIGPGR